MTTYRVKPPQVVEVEAIRWTGDNTDEVRAFVGPRMTVEEQPHGTLHIEFYGGFTIPSRGDWIVRKPGATAVHHVDAAVFEKTYEPVRAAGSSAPSPDPTILARALSRVIVELDDVNGWLPTSLQAQGEVYEAARESLRNLGMEPERPERAPGSSAPRPEGFPDDVPALTRELCAAVIEDDEMGGDLRSGTATRARALVRSLDALAAGVRPEGHADDPGPCDCPCDTHPEGGCSCGCDCQDETVLNHAREEGRRAGIEEAGEAICGALGPGEWSHKISAALDRVRSLSDGGGSRKDGGK